MDQRSSLTEKSQKRNRVERSPVSRPLIKLIAEGAANLQSPVIDKKFLP